MKSRIVFATKNQGKIKEINMILKDLGINVVSMEDIGINIDVIEDGKTFEENAMKKAKEIMEVTNEIVLADDSGLEVDYLNKEPGIYSARYGGVDTSYDIKNNMIIDKLQGVPDEKRTARFVCVIAAAFPSGEIKTTRGTIEGIIGHEQKGTNGFGYDPIFYVPEYKCTTAQMDSELKNSLSHRGKALSEMKKHLQDYFAL